MKTFLLIFILVLLKTIVFLGVMMTFLSPRAQSWQVFGQLGTGFVTQFAFSLVLTLILLTIVKTKISVGSRKLALVSIFAIDLVLLILFVLECYL